MNNLFALQRRLASLALVTVVHLLVNHAVSSAQGSLVAFYPFDGNANDASGNGHNGTVNGAVLASDRFGSPNSAYAFDGNDWIEVRHTNDLNFGRTSVFTINAWVKACQSQDEFAGIVAKGPTNTYIPGYQLVIRDELPEGLISRDNGDFVGVLGTKRILDSSWHMLTLIVDAPAGEVRLYIDGVHSKTSFGSGIEPSFDNLSNLFIGKERNSTRYAKGAIDDVAIFDYALSDATIAEYYREGGWPFFAGQGSLTIQTPDGTSYCRAGSVRLLATGSLRYRWSPATGLSNPNIANPIASPSVTTTYTVTGLREDFPCGTTLTAQVTITVGDPVPDLGPDTTVCAGGSVQIGAVPTAGTAPYRYQWSPASGLSDPTAERPVASPTTTTDYVVTVIDAAGCIGRDTIRVSVVASGLAASTTSLDFGVLSGCSSSIDSTVTITNNGTTPLDLANVTVSGPGYTLLDVTPGGVLAPGASAVIGVRFAPISGGRSVGSLTIRTAPCDAMLSIELSGIRSTASLQLVPDTVDFGDDTGCSPIMRDTVVFVTNLGAAPVTLQSGSVAPPFSILDPQFPVAIAANGSQAVRIRLENASDGSYNGVLELVVRDGACIDTLRVLLLYRRAGVRLEITGQSNYGSNLPGTVVDRIQVVINRSATDVRIDSMTIAAPFSVVATNPSLPATLRPGDSITVTTRYVASDALDSAELVVFTEVPCTYRAGLQLRGGGDERAYCRVYIPHLTAASGEVLDVPLLIDSAQALRPAGAYRFTATIAFDRTLLYPAEGFPITVDDSVRRIVVTGSRRDESDVLAMIPMTAMLGRVDSTVLAIESFEWIEPLAAITTTKVDGFFALARNCPEGGTRRYHRSNGVLLRPVVPNPGTTSVIVQFEIVENGRTRLDVVDALGAVVTTLIDGPMTSGTHALELDVSSIPPGAYMLVLATPTQLRSEPFKVAR